ncbi:multidrug ABC transporter ATPase [Nitzschia inconspicua]|uniref:Multidrug ABC transporter ATPase n=1 Tax=Nitzschia inconspicua TaxID=303405 RepID=A0A9K3L7K9_9STRA|nr:multidrug ABC transporter ATPase [Nitzschia inconspicua]
MSGKKDAKVTVAAPGDALDTSGIGLDGNSDYDSDRGGTPTPRVPGGPKRLRALYRGRAGAAAPPDIRRNNSDGSVDNVGASHGKSRLSRLVRRRRASQRYVNKLLKKERESAHSFVTEDHKESEEDVTGIDFPKPAPMDKAERIVSGASSIISGDELTEEEKEQLKQTSKGLLLMNQTQSKYASLFSEFPIEIRMCNFTFSVPYTETSNKLKTVYNSSFVYQAVKIFKRLREGNFPEKKEEVKYKIVLDNVSLRLRPGKMYLVLGPPGSGKSSLLKVIAGRIRPSGKNDNVTGDVTFNGKSFEDQTDIHIENAIALIDQLDRHAPRYTVEDTFNFAFRCKRRYGHHADFRFTPDTPENRELAKAADEANLTVDVIIKALGLDHVRGTFVGNEEIRGVSGGQRRRVTIGEMLMNPAPILCGDEISNGLDATSTYDIMNILMHVGKIRKKVQIISLLQPSPETVALFDEVILLGEGKILYAGPISQVEDYFAALGYAAPVHMDVGDFLQIIATPDGAKYYDPSPDMAARRSMPYTLDELASEFQNSHLGKNIMFEIKEAHQQVWGSAHGDVSKFDDAEYLDDRRYKEKYANYVLWSTWLNFRRQITLWRRDKRVLIANAVKNLIMGVSVGGVFFQTDDVVSILGVLFQGMLFVMLSGMVSAPTFVDERLIYYKQSDSNFFGAFSFVIAKALSKLPQTAMDCINFGTILYYMVGLAPQPSYFFTFMGVIFVFNILMTELLFVFSTFAVTKSAVQVSSACLVFFFMLFCGFIIAPNTIPNYYTWIYWYNPLSWAYRSLILNEFTSSKYSQQDGDAILTFLGFVNSQGEPFNREWILWGFIFMLSHIVLSLTISGLLLHYVRVHGEASPSFEAVEKAEQELKLQSEGASDDSTQVNIPFKPITLSFEDISYDVKTSTGDEDLRLLHDISGCFRAGRMCALMGESGAGKTTLMDVIALRKNSGSVKGNVYVNGFPRDAKSFRRCSGYVEQFDIQSPQLTVRETVLFSGRLRLDADKVKSDKQKKKYCDMVLKILELAPLADSLVGSSESGGLSFEQKKRLSIAVELAASPSILFLDEPTTGLDSRSASLVVKILRKVADQGRTICATIHQPSSAVFAMFDDLLLLKSGGYSVYHGPLGSQCKTLVKYFEGHGATPIEAGDNPSNWMLREIPKSEKDFAALYHGSQEYAKLRRQLEAARTNPPKELEIWYKADFAVPSSERQRLMNKRLQTVYWRSPTYNLSRLLVCVVIAFILGSVFITERQLTTLTESQIRAYFSVTFLSFIIVGILCIISVLPVMLAIRDVFYKQRAAGMVDNTALGWALGTAEKWFMILASSLFCLVYLSTSGTFPASVRRAISFWGFFTFNLAIYSYFGQAFMCLVPAMATAQILCSVFIGLNNFFSGLIVRPQYMVGLFAFTYWITPGHYVYEGLIISQYWGDERPVLAVQNSDFWNFLGCDDLEEGEDCYGTVTQYLWVFFGGKFNKDNELQDILVLALFLVIARVSTFFALRAFNYTNT